jgi:hypothetical protein
MPNQMTLQIDVASGSFYFEFVEATPSLKSNVQGVSGEEAQEMTKRKKLERFRDGYLSKAVRLRIDSKEGQTCRCDFSHRDR